MKSILFVFISIAMIAACTKDGAQGPQGVPGQPGLPGQPGSPGSPGAPGTGCTVQTIAPTSVAPNGGAQITCGDTQALVLNGTNGSPGTLIEPIQFCQSDTSQYPKTFPEVGFCVNGSIYAVYSTNGGFLTLVPPGIYKSNAVGSKCDFTVLTGCSITGGN